MSKLGGSLTKCRSQGQIQKEVKMEVNCLALDLIDEHLNDLNIKLDIRMSNVKRYEW